MFATLPLLPADPILDLGRIFAADDRAEKINLGIGVFLDEQGETPIMRAVAAAEEHVARAELTKAYLPPKGEQGFIDGIKRLALGKDGAIIADERSRVVQTPGGCGALGVAGGMMRRSGVKTITMGTPTWSNHKPVFAAAGLDVRMIPYYVRETGGVDFDGFIDGVKKLGKTDALLIHGACHNPTGADLTNDQIDTVIECAQKQGFLVMVDTAYHGLGNGLSQDGYVLNAVAERLPEALISYSCSKNFGLYRERTGAIVMIGENAERAAALESHALDVARQTYSMAPAHGALIVSTILGSAALEQNWRDELNDMQAIIQGRRELLANALRSTPLGNRLAYVTENNGMFSLLPLSPEQVETLRNYHAVHLVGSGRINVCGVHENNVERLAAALSDTICASNELQSA